MAKRSEIALAELNRQFSAIDLKLASGQGQPGVSLSGGVAMALGQSTPGTSADAEYATVGVKLTLPILDGGAVQAQVASSKAMVDLYQTQAQQLRLSIAADIRDAFWQLTIQSKKVEVAKQSQDLYEDQPKLVQTQNSFGTATNQDLMIAAVNAANAEVSYAAAKNSYLLAMITLETAMGL
jgi:outer membrane protein TolC